MEENKVFEATQYINLALSRHSYAEKAEIAIILGSGLGTLSEKVDIKVSIPYKEIPCFPVSTAPGHKGRLVFGTLDGKPVILMDGRFHFYEGYGGDEIAVAIRTLKMLGVKNLIVTNAAGGINRSFKAGDLMLITDHINFSGKNPLVGKNDPDFGPRFPDMSEPYDKKLQRIAHKAAEEMGIELKEGVYIWFMGPSYETCAEIRMARIMGADAVGMSTVPETIVAVHAGIKVMGISLIANPAAGVSAQKLDEEDVIAAANSKRDIFAEFVRRIVSKIV